MALGGYPGHGTTQYTSVHHHSISHNDGDDDGYVSAAPIAGGYLPAAVPATRYAGFGGPAAGYVGGPAAGYVGGPAAGYVGGRYGAAPFVGGRVYHPRHVHVGVGTPGVKVEVETAKSTIHPKPAMHVTAQVSLFMQF